MEVGQEVGKLILWNTVDSDHNKFKEPFTTVQLGTTKDKLELESETFHLTLVQAFILLDWTGAQLLSNGY